MRLIAVASSSLWLLPGLAAASPGYDEAPRVAKIVDGEPTTTDPAVVALGLRDVCQGTRTVYCTGTLVAPRVVLTAAHCLSAAVETVEVFVGHDTNAGGVWLRAAALRSAEGFDPLTYDHDIGVVILGEDAPVEPVPMQVEALSGALVGTDARIVGFGVPEPAGGEVGLARSGLTTVAAVDALSFDIVPNPAMSCQVDSGGPVLLTDAQGIERVAGITSTGDAFCETDATNTRVDAYQDTFVTAALDEAASGSLVPPPPPSTDTCPGCSVFGCGAGEVCDLETDSCVPEPSMDPDVDAKGCVVAPVEPSRPSPWGCLLLAAITAASLATRRRSARR